MSSSQNPDPEKPQEEPFISHLIELRDRLLRSVLAVLIIFVILFPFANEIYTYIADPMLRNLTGDAQMIITKPLSAFLTPLRTVLVFSVYIAVPFLLYQIWSFVAPGLYKHEKQLAIPLLASSVFLFYLGAVFAYYVVLPLIFAFIAGTVPEGANMTPDISFYLDLVLKLFFAFGVAFEVPVATVILVAAGLTTPDSLREKRPYVIVGAFVVGMLLTPPDLISQTFLAVPVWLLFEVGVIASQFVLRSKLKRAAAEDAEYRSMTDEEMDDELDRIEEEESEQKR